MSLTCTHFEPGEQIDALTVAGAPLDVYQGLGIVATVFDHGDEAWVPEIHQQDMQPGSGHFDEFADLLVRAVAPRRLVFVNVINARFGEHLRRCGFETRDVE